MAIYYSNAPKSGAKEGDKVRWSGPEALPTLGFLKALVEMNTYKRAAHAWSLRHTHTSLPPVPCLFAPNLALSLSHRLCASCFITVSCLSVAPVLTFAQVPFWKSSFSFCPVCVRLAVTSCVWVTASLPNYMSIYLFVTLLFCWPRTLIKHQVLTDFQHEIPHTWGHF